MMPLFHIQDPDRPAYVVASNYQQAVARWQVAVAAENECSSDEIEFPDGVSRICLDSDLILGDTGFVDPI